MAITIASDFDTQYEITQSSTEWIFEEGIWGTAPIHEANTISDSLIRIDGFIETTTTGVDVAGTRTKVIVGGTGYVSAQNSFLLSGSDQTLENHGLIIGDVQTTGAGAHITNYGHIFVVEFGFQLGSVGGILENFGRITGLGAIYLEGDGIEIICGKSSVISTTDGIVCFNDAGESIVIKNAGTLSSHSDWPVIFGSDGNETLINTGQIRGIVFLDGGNDTYDGRGGTVTDFVVGGSGDDTFIVDSAQTKIGDNTGTDTVKTTVSLSFVSALYANEGFDNLVLLGKSNINATGNDLQNEIVGNAGRNILKGLGGMDTFVLKNKCGHDIVADFSVGEDVIDLARFKGITNESDLLKNHVKFQNGDLVIFAGKDEIRFDGVGQNELKNVDFVFDL